MSIGHCGYADLVLADDVLAIYTYCCFNLNSGDFERFRRMADGELYIDRDAFVEPEIHEKIIRRPSGRKVKSVKRILRWVPIEELIADGKIKVKNASGTWQTIESGTDIMAIRILRGIFKEYQETGTVPEHIGWAN